MELNTKEKHNIITQCPFEIIVDTLEPKQSYLIAKTQKEDTIIIIDRTNSVQLFDIIDEYISCDILDCLDTKELNELYGCYNLNNTYAWNSELFCKTANIKKIELYMKILDVISSSSTIEPICQFIGSTEYVTKNNYIYLRFCKDY